MARAPLLLYGATGRMGRAVRACLPEFPEIELMACVAPREPAKGAAPGPIWLTPEELTTRRRRESLPDDLVVLDFSLAAGTARLVDVLVMWPRPLVSATTGLDPGTESKIQTLAQRVPVLRSTNLSMGNAVVEAFLRALPPVARDTFVADIVEHHHSGKRDAPSGTARVLAQTLGPTGVPLRERGEVLLHSIRGGSVPGTHRVILSGTGETVEIVHTVNDRSIFARGALRAVEYVHGRAPGSYTIEQLLRET
jgi:4-hydroxy-tetrahydrodipicolinate reductase